MNKQIIVSLTLLLFFSLALSAQKISGTVSDTENRPIEFASVALYSLPDSTIVTGSVTNQQGEFSLSPNGAKDVFLKISLIGYETTTKIITEINEPFNITLNTSDIILQDVVVQANRISRSAKGYGIVLTGSDLVKGKQASNVLRFLPSVSYENGVYKINGLAVSEIYINDVKITNIKELETIAGEYLTKADIEYFAGSENRANMIGGIIRIQMKQPKEGGYYGNVTLRGGAKPHYGLDNTGAGAMISYQYRKWNIYNNLNLGHNRYYDEMEISKFNTNSLQNVLKSKEYNDGKTNMTFNRLSVTYDINAKNTLGVSLYANLYKGNFNSKSDFEIPQNALSNNIHSSNKTLQTQATVNYKSVLNDKGTNLSISGDYLLYQNEAENNYSIGAEKDANNTKNTIDLWKVDANVKTPIGKAMQLTGGGAVNLTQIHFLPVELATYNWSSPMTEANMRSVSPYAYVSLAGQKEVFRYNVGLNLQQNTIYYKEQNTLEEAKNTQQSISPNFQLMYMLNPDKGHIAMLMFKRNLDDIPYDAINPNVVWTDQYNYTTGNPDLKAQKSNVVMTSLSLFNNKLDMSGFFVYASNTIYYQTLQDVDNPDVLFTKPINLSGNTIWAMTLESSQRITKWWQLKGGGRYEYHKENAVFGAHHYNGGNHRFYFGLDNNFKFKNNFGGTLSASLEPTFKHYERIYHGVYSVSGSFYKSLLKNKLNAGINFIALGKMRKLERKSENHTIISANKTHVPRISLSLTWFFNGGKDVNVKTTESIQQYKEIRDVN